MTKRAAKIFMIMGMVTAVAAAGFMLLTPAPVKSAHQYSGTLYVAGMGGHIATVDVNIDPASKNPIQITKIDRIELGESSTHPVHDVRIDGNDMYWATYKKDKSANNQLHYGKIDLKSGNVTADKKVALPDTAAWAGANYCGSGQTPGEFITISMAKEGYATVIDKKTMEVKEQVQLGSLVPDGNYKFFHGTNHPDGKMFLISANLSTPKTKDSWDATGDVLLVNVDTAALAKGEIKEINRNVIKGGNKNKTVSFRQYFTPDGKYLLQSANDTFLLVDAKTLKLVAKENRQGLTEGKGGNHDAMPTPDGKYAILTLREANPEINTEEKIIDGFVQLYDIEKKELVGKPVSVCWSCHKDEGYDGKSILCGIEATWK